MIGLTIASCEKDVVENGLDTTSEEILQNELFAEAVQVDPTMQYFLHGKQITNETKITDLLKNAAHVNFEEDKVTFYPTEEEQEKELKAYRSSSKKRDNARLFYFGKHNKKKFHFITSGEALHYNTLGHHVHLSNGKLTSIKLWKKITKPATIINYSAIHNHRVIFYSKAHFKGQSRSFQVKKKSRRRNIKLPWHIGSHDM